MRIYYDGIIYTIQVNGGINKYFYNLISRLPGYYNPILTITRSGKANFPGHTNLSLHTFKGFWPRRISYRMAKCYFKLVERIQSYDVVHPTYYSTFTGTDFRRYGKPVVITVHDMIHEIYQEHLDPAGEMCELKRKAIGAADSVICVSHNTKRDLLERYKIPEEKIRVIYHGIDLCGEVSYGPERVPDQPYFIYVGSRASYKNFNGLLAAFARLVSTRPDVRLCVAGPPFTPDEEKLIHQSRLTDYCAHYGYVTDEHLAKLYRCSLALVYPSFYEGFGIPPLEAMSCGTSVVAADCSSIPEIVGDAGLLFDPRKTDEFVSCLLYLVDNPGGRASLVTKGKERAKKFSWDRAVRETLDVYRSLS